MFIIQFVNSNIYNSHEVLPHAISVLQAKGYRLVTLAECLGQPAYQSVGAPSVRDVSPSIRLLSVLVNNYAISFRPRGHVKPVIPISVSERTI